MAGSLDSTQALLDYTIQDSCLQDSSEDEVFFGAVHSVEKRGRSNIRLDTTIEERDFSPVKISKQLERSNYSLLSADNSIPEESEEEDIEEMRGKVGRDAMSTSSAIEGEEGEKTSGGNKCGGEVGEARTSQGSSEGWETESETSCMEVSSSDANEMEVSVEISGIVRHRESSLGGENEEKEARANEIEGEVVRVNEEEEEYRKDIQFLVEKEAVDEESDEEDEDTSQCIEQEVGEEAELPVGEMAPPEVRLTRPSCEWSRCDFKEVQPEPGADDDSRPTSQLSHLPEETSSRSIYHTAPSSPRRSEVPEPCFDTTADEMILFEMFGDCYDEKVESMSTEEKRELQEELERMKARESVSALRARMLRIGAVGSNRSSIASTMSSFSPHASPSPAPSPMHATPMEDRSDEKPFEEVLGEQIEDSLQRRLIQEQEQELQEKILQKQKEERLRWEREDSRRQKVEAQKEEVERGTTPRRLEEEMERGTTPRGRKVLREGEAAYTQHTQASLFRQVSPSPKKTPISSRPAWVPASPIPGRELALSPVKPFGAARPPSRIPQPVTAKPIPALRTVKAAQMVVSSPVADYVKNNPAPHLVRNVVAKEAVRPLDSTLMEVEGNKENLAMPACPLPANTYTSAHLFQETRHASVPVREYRYIPEAYGLQGSAEASVTKHLSRKKVDQDQMQRNESVVRAMTPKAPMTNSSSSLEVSLLETKVVRKFATPLRKADPNL